MFRACSIPAPPIFRGVPPAVAAALFTFASACTPTSAPVSETIIGAWINTRETFEFFEGGRALGSRGPIGRDKLAARYEFVADDRMLLSIDDTPVQVVYRVKIEDGQLSLCEEGGIDACSNLIRFDPNTVDPFEFRMNRSAGVDIPLDARTEGWTNEAKIALSDIHQRYQNTSGEERARLIRELSEENNIGLPEGRYFEATLVSADGDALCVTKKSALPGLPHVSIDADRNYYYSEDCS